MTEKSRSYSWVMFCSSLLFVFLSLGSYQGLAQSVRTIKGVVIDDESKQTLPGASVKVRNSNTAVSTNVNGGYTIQAKSGDVLVFSFIGYESKSITVGNSSTINVALSPDSKSLNEVFVIGYGTVSRPDLTGSVAQVKMVDMEKSPVSSFEEALAGRVPGVTVSSSDGQPGEGMSVIIRGASSLTQSTSPLYVIDGFPVEDFDRGSINPDDIESINILKDASASAIYGSRAANGVVMIETKRGKEGAPVITFNNTVGIQQPQKLMDVLSPYEFVKFSFERNASFAKTFYKVEKEEDLEKYRGVSGINWQEEVFQTTPYRIHSLAVRGGTKQTKYSISGSIYDQQGIILNSGYDRYQGRFSLDQTISKKLKAGITTNYSKRITYGSPVAEGGTNSFTSNLLSRAWGYRPISGNLDVNLLEEDFDDDIISQFDVRLNPVVTAKNEYKKNFITDFMANAYLEYDLVKNLKLKLTGSVSSRDTRNEAFYNSKTVQGNLLNLFNTKGINGSVYNSELSVWSNENYLTYTKTFNKSHKLTAMGGFSLQMTNNKRYGHAMQQIPNEELGMSGMDHGTIFSTVSTLSGNTLNSVFGRINYGFKSKYLFTATMRYDGSSKFAAEDGRKWGTYPSAAFAWNMHEEPLFKSLNFLTESKLRVSYGTIGNNRVGDFSYLPSLSFPLGSSYSFNNSTPALSAIITEMGNSRLKWETSEQLDLGYDLGLFKNRVNLTVDLYSKTTKDLLLDADLPTTTGFTSVFKNIGKIRNEGLEISLNTINVKKKSYSWSSNFNISFNRNKVVALTKGQDKLFSFASFESQFNGTPLYVSQVGQPVGLFYGYIFDGVYQYSDFDNPSPNVYTLKTNLPNNGAGGVQPGDIKYRDINNDGTINTYDLAVIGRGLPVHTGGFTNNFTYKNFTANVFLQWSYGNDIYNANRLQFDGNANGRSINQFASYANRWSPINPTNENFRVGGAGPIGFHSSRVLEDGSYLRLKTFSVGYNIPSKVTNMFYVNKLNVSVAAQNFFTWTNYSGMDPEVSVRNSVLTPGFDFSAYPNAKTVVFALKATF